MEAPAPIDESLLLERELRATQIGLERARVRVAEAEAARAELRGRIVALERRLREAEAIPRALSESLEAERRARRRAEQNAFAERARRTELQDELALLRSGPNPSWRERERRRRAEREARIAELEGEVRALERALAEAEYGARVPRAPAAPRRRVGNPEHVRAEATLLAVPRAAGGAAPAPSREGRRRAREAIAAELALRSPLAAEARGPGATRADARVRRAVEAIARLREEVSVLAARVEEEGGPAGLPETGAPGEGPRDPVAAAEAVSALVRPEAAEEGREEPQPGRAAPEAEPAPESALSPSVGIEPARLAAALQRLRDSTPAEPAQPAPVPPPGRAVALPPAPDTPGAPTPWLGPALTRLLERDPAQAGRAIVALLPAQHLVHPGPLAYDLDLGPDGVIEVRVEGAATRLLRRPPGPVAAREGRPLGAIDTRLMGDLAGVARLVLGGRRRLLRLGRHRRARVRGGRAGLAALQALLRAPVTLAALSEAGVEMAPELAFGLLAAMIPADWAGTRAFTLAHHSPLGHERARLLIRPGTRPEPAPGRGEERGEGTAETVLVCPPEDVLRVLAGRPVTAAQVLGEVSNLALVRAWAALAQRL